MSTLGIGFYRRCTAMLAGRGLRQYRWVNRLNEFVLRQVKTHEAVVLGHRMQLDRSDSLELSIRGIYEPLETRLAQELIRPGGCAVDVGANIGYYTLLLARGVGPRGRVYAFEPEPQNFSLLEKNVRSNGYANVQLERKAASDTTGSLQLFVSRENQGDHRVYASPTESRGSVHIRAVRLDDYFRDEFPEIDLLKMDIQGAEGHALLGMSEMLRCRPPRAILTEFWPLGLKRAGSEAARILQLLEARGYRLHLLNESTGRTVPMGADELLARFTVENGHQANLLAQLAD